MFTLRWLDGQLKSQVSYDKELEQSDPKSRVIGTHIISPNPHGEQKIPQTAKAQRKNMVNRMSSSFAEVDENETITSAMEN